MQVHKLQNKNTYFCCILSLQPPPRIYIMGPKCQIYDLAAAILCRYDNLPLLLLLLDELKPEHDADIVSIQDLKCLSIGEALPLEEFQWLGAIEYGTTIRVRPCSTLVDASVAMLLQLRLKPQIVVILLHFLETKDLQERLKVIWYPLISTCIFQYGM